MEFVNNISSRVFDKIYLETVRTATNIIGSIHVQETNHEQNTTDTSDVTILLNWQKISVSLLHLFKKEDYIDQQTGYFSNPLLKHVLHPKFTSPIFSIFKK